MKRLIFLVALLCVATAFFRHLPITLAAISVSYNSGTDTIEVTGSGACNLSDIDTALGDPVRLYTIGGTTWVLNASLTTSENVDLEITDEDCLELRINSTDATGTRRIDVDGDYTIANTTVYGWEDGAVDTDLTNGRSYLYSDYADTCVFYNTTFAYLGNGSSWDLGGDMAGITQKWTENSDLTDLCTFHNMTLVVYRSTAAQINISRCNFYDAVGNNSLWLTFSDTWQIDDIYMENASTVTVDYSDGGFYRKYVNNVTIENVGLTDSNITFKVSDSFLIGIYDLNLTNCGNTSIWVAHNNVNIWFYRLFMLGTGLAAYTGFLVTDCDILRIMDSTFYGVERIRLLDSMPTNVTFSGNTVYGNLTTTYGLQLYSGLVENNFFYNISRDAIMVITDSVIRNNTVHTCDGGVSVHGGQFSSPHLGAAQNILIEDNTLENCTLATDAWSCGIKVGGHANNITIEDNVIEGGNAGILVWSNVSDLTIQRNNISIAGWGIGESYTPLGYTDMGGPVNMSDKRLIAGVVLSKMWTYSWNWTEQEQYGIDNVTITDNNFNTTYMQAYIHADLPVTELNVTDTNNFNTTTYFQFNFTDSFLGGQLVYLEPANPIYYYSKGNQSTRYYAYGLDSTHFNFTVDTTSLENITLISIFNPNDNYQLTHHQANDNVSRLFELYTDFNNSRAWCYWRQHTISFNSLDLRWNTTVAAGNNGTWTLTTDMRPDRVLFNGAAHPTNWTWTGEAALIVWNYSSSVEIYVELEIAPWDPFEDYSLLGIGMFGFLLVGVGCFWGAKEVINPQIDYGTKMIHIGLALVFLILGSGLIIAWLW